MDHSVLPSFLLETVFISLSGVMAPGPITAVAVGKGSESPYAGALVAIGHGIVEFPLIAAVFWGVGSLLSGLYVKTAIALVGGVFLLYMGVSMFRSARRAEMSSSEATRMPIIAGAVLSAGNPFFLIWWATIGAALIARSIQFGIGGLAAFAVVHWSCDLVWCSFLSVLSFKGGRFFGRRFQEVLFAACGVCLVFFGGKFIVDAARTFLA
jgi:threonine/homoserine/homoserine lactone efflux protein